MIRQIHLKAGTVKNDNSNVNTTASNVANQSSNSANLNGSLSYVNVNYNLSNTNPNIGSQLLLFTKVGLSFIFILDTYCNFHPYLTPW